MSGKQLREQILSFKSLFMALIKSEIDWRGEKCPKFYENRPKGPVTV